MNFLIIFDEFHIFLYYLTKCDNIILYMYVYQLNVIQYPFIKILELQDYYKDEEKTTT